LSEIEGEANIGYWIARAHWGQGYATEAGRAMLALARGLGHKRLVGRHFLDNPASGLVLRRLGFRPTDERRLIFSAGRGRACPSVRLEIELESEQGNQDDSPNGAWKEGVRRNQKLRHSCENV
jgi:RimJ/RimL family protein N-acetyltransferase